MHHYHKTQDSSGSDIHTHTTVWPPIADKKLKMVVGVFLFVYRRRRKADANINARNSSLHESEDTSGDRVREHNYGYVVNAAFDQDEPQSTHL